MAQLDQILLTADRLDGQRRVAEEQSSARDEEARLWRCVEYLTIMLKELGLKAEVNSLTAEALVDEITFRCYFQRERLALELSDWWGNDWWFHLPQYPAAVASEADDRHKLVDAVRMVRFRRKWWQRMIDSLLFS